MGVRSKLEQYPVHEYAQSSTISIKLRKFYECLNIILEEEEKFPQRRTFLRITENILLNRLQST